MKVCASCGRRLHEEWFTKGKGVCKRCRADAIRERRLAERPDEEAEYRAEQERLAERVRFELARIEKGLEPDYSDLDSYDRIQVRLAVVSLHENPDADYYVSGLARFVVETA